jgi:hypothetical protein
MKCCGSTASVRFVRGQQVGGKFHPAHFIALVCRDRDTRDLRGIRMKERRPYLVDRPVFRDGRAQLSLVDLVRLGRGLHLSWEGALGERQDVEAGTGCGGIRLD